jgi:hypothetical protein
MLVIENANVVSRSFGDHNVVIVENENTGMKLRLQNPKAIDLELGIEGRLIYKEEPVCQLVSFEPMMVEELV